ncbi:MAG TPA: oligosaccharide flippase family protein [bacterium]|nr:oligosaccharide flippase family protein [bacterium]HPV65134.1 oligosaccharide flippase family protein [bacterium]
MIEKIKIAVYKLLKKSEKWTKTDMIYLAKGGFWLTLGQGVSSVSSFLLAIAFANLLPKETYGTYKYIMSIVSLLAIPTLAGMNTAIIQAVARGYEGSVMPAFKTKVKWGLLGGLASLILTGYYYFQGNNTLAISFLITAVFVPFMDSLLIYDSYLNGKKNFKALSNYTIITRIVSMIVMVGAIFLTKNIFLIIASYFTINTLLRIIFFKITFLKNKLNTENDPETISYGKHLSLMGVLNTFSFYIDKLLLFHFFGAHELAIYSIAIAPIEQMKGLIKVTNSLMLPKFSSINLEQTKKQIWPKIIKMILILIILFLVYILVAPIAFNILFPEYRESIFFSQVFSLSLVLAGPIFVLTSILQADKKTKMLYKFNIITPIFSIITNSLLIYKFNIMGAVIAKIINYCFNLLVLKIMNKN